VSHSTPLVATVVGGIVMAFLLGTLAQRLRISPIAGYLLAGVLVGPFTPGFVADRALAGELAEIGVILLMFGVGLHFSLKDLLAVARIAVPGALAQIAAATLLGAGLGLLMGWGLGAGIIFGLALSVASTVVLLRALQERRLLDSERGRIAVGWLIVEDLAMVLALVLLPALAGLLGGGDGAGEAKDPAALARAVALTLGKVGLFVALMLVVGRRVIPWGLHYVAHTGSRELFRLAVLAIALGIAFGSAVLFGVSFALGAFFAGMVLSESELSHQAANETLPLRDAFAVLFFVSVGLLFDPAILLHRPLPVLATVAVIMVGKSAVALALVRIFGHSWTTALTISASLAQVGEFSFILAALGVQLGLLPEAGRDLVLAGAILSILANPLLFALLDRVAARSGDAAAAVGPVAPALPRTGLAGHVVLVGYGRVGAVVGAALRAAGRPLLVVEERLDLVDRLRAEGVEAIAANAVAGDVLAAANIAGAAALVLAVPNGFEAADIARQARAAHPALPIIARAHTDAEVAYLERHGATLTIMGEREIARGMLDYLAGSAPA
jgi:CPA2 family monovalent cation:H+ antiporter-2